MGSPVRVTGVSSSVDEVLNILGVLGCEDGPEELAINSLGRLPFIWEPGVQSWDSHRTRIDSCYGELRPEGDMDTVDLNLPFALFGPSHNLLEEVQCTMRI